MASKLGIQIDAKDWKEFKHFVNENYPRPSFTHEQKDFVRKCLMADNNHCSDMNKLWISVFAEHLLEFVNENWPMDAGSISEQMDVLKTCIAKAAIGFLGDQHQLRQRVPSSERSPEQVRMLEVHPNIVNFPVDLAIDMGRILNLKSKATTALAGSKDQGDVHLFRVLHNHIQKMHEEMEGKGAPTEAGPSTGKVAAVEEDFEWYPHGNEDTFLRMCTYKVWCDKYEQEERYSPNKMCNEWLKEAIQLYNNVSYHWPNCKHKRFGANQFHDIRQTCIHSWLPEVQNRAFVAGHKAKKPTTNWVSDWCSYPVTEKRHEWEGYFCSVISHAKDIAKVMHQTEHIQMEVDEGVGEPALKRSRSEEQEQLTEGSVEYKISQIIHREFARMGKTLHRMENNAQNRHQDSMRELTGHFNPVRNQLMQISQGQGHIYGALDRMQHMKG